MYQKQLDLGKGLGASLVRWKHSGLNVVAAMLMLLLVTGCSKDDEATPEVTAPPTEETPTQYGTPFANVPSTEDIAMYEVNLRTFSASGDLKGVQEGLDHIKALGINVVWLMPIYPTADEKSVGSPYAIKSYTEVNPDFGTLADLRMLVEEAHNRDMAVMLDWVANHTAWDHPWIKTPSWYARDASGNIISPPGMGWNDVAELNFSSQAMRKEMIEAMKYWVLEANVDGYRCDYAEGVPTDFWKQAIDSLRAIPNRELIMFAEGGKKEFLTAGFNLIFGWNFYNKLKDVYNNNASATGLATVHASDYTNIPAGTHILRWTTNHDDHAWDASPVTIFKNEEGSLAAFVITAYMGGVPLIYSGQEVGYPNTLGFFENTTTTIDWSSNPEVLAEYQQLMAFRSSSEALRGGTLETFPSGDVMAFKRISAAGEEVVVLVNVRNIQVDFQLPASLANTTWLEALTDETVTLNNAVSLAPYAYIVLRK